MKKKRLISLILAALCLSGAGGEASAGFFSKKKPEVTLPEDLPSKVVLKYHVEAPGTQEERSDDAVIDYSNVSEGYVMVQYTGASTNPLKAQVAGPETTYTYTLTPDVWAAFPLSDGDGTYRFTVLEGVGGSKYAVILGTEAEVKLTDEFAPFLRPNQYVNYGEAPKAVAVAAKLAEGRSDTLEIVGEIYNFVVGYLTYDKQKAETVKTGYLPDLDAAINEKKGICFDYAALMTGMLRSLNIPCKLVVGYAGEAYHAWISVWSDKEGWIEKVVYFDGKTWQRMDPTFASSEGDNSEFIGNGDNYVAKYFY